MKTNRILYILPIALGLVACEPEFDDIDFNAGSADFSRTVAVGNSLTAGFQSNALSLEGQENSIPAIIAEQLREIGGGEFKQPLLSGEAGEKGAGIVPSLLPANLIIPELFLGPSTNCLGETSLAPTVGTPYSSASFFNPVGQNGPFNNVGIPGARVIHLNLPGYGNPANLITNPPSANPYYVRFVNPSNIDETVVEAAVRAKPTFFELWIGNNDVLGYATSGGDEGGDAITPQGTFAALYNRTLDSLTKNGAKGAVANIPNIIDIPYFTTIPTGTSAIDAQTAALLNAAYSAYNAGLDQVVANNSAFKPEADLRKISFKAGQFNQFVVLDPSLTPIQGLPSIRQIRNGEFLTLTTPGDSLLCAQWGTAKPIPGNFHLTTTEVKKITDAIGGFNLTIRTAANARSLAYVNVSSKLSELASDRGITISGINFNSALVSGGAFSLDGVHPSTRGYAIIANEFIDAINRTYNGNIRKVDVASYPALEVGQ